MSWDRNTGAVCTVGRRLGDGEMYIIDVHDMAAAGLLIRAYNQGTSQRHTLTVSEAEVKKQAYKPQSTCSALLRSSSGSVSRLRGCHVDGLSCRQRGCCVDIHDRRANARSFRMRIILCRCLFLPQLAKAGVSRSADDLRRLAESVDIYALDHHLFIHSTLEGIAKPKVIPSGQQAR